MDRFAPCSSRFPSARTARLRRAGVLDVSRIVALSRAGFRLSSACVNGGFSRADAAAGLAERRGI